MTEIHQRRKVKSMALSPRFIDHLAFVFDFRQLPCWYFLHFPLFSTAAFVCIGHSHGFTHRIKFVHKIVVTQ